MMLIVNMSDNEDLLADDLGDHSLADYNLGNEEEDQLLADDYEGGHPQNVPPSMSSYDEAAASAPSNYPQPEVQFPNQRIQYHLQPDTECVVPNITVEVPNVPERPSYAPYEPPQKYICEVEQHVPPAMPAMPMEPPQIVPTEMPGNMPNGAGAAARSRFPSERPAGAQRTPMHRDIPDSLDAVVVPRGGWGGRARWRSPHYGARHHNPYRRNNVHRGNFNPRASFPPPRNIRPNSPQMLPNIRPNPPQLRPDMRPDLPLNIRPDLPPNIRPDLPPNIRHDLPPNRPDLLPNIRPDLPPNIMPDLPLNIRPDLPPNRPDLPPEGLPPNPDLPRPEFHPEMRSELPLPPGQDLPPEGLIMDQFRPDTRPSFRFQYRPNEPRQFNPNMRPNFEPFGYQRPFRPFPPMREVAPNMNHLPQVTIRHGVPAGPQLGKQEVRMLPVQLPPVPGGLQGKKVLINPHFKGNFQPPVEVLAGAPAYIPTRIQKTPPLSPTLEDKFGPVKDIDDAAERFIAEQRNALARAATRKFPPRRSPQRFVENTTIEIENELARPVRRRSEDDDLLRRQEEFINANRAGLRRRMRSPSPPRRSVSPRRSLERARPRADTRPDVEEEDGEYRRRMREQEALRDRVMRAKEARRRKRAVAATHTTHAATRADSARVERSDEHNRDRDRLDKPEPKPANRPEHKPVEVKEPVAEPDKPDTTRTSPDNIQEKRGTEKEKERDRSPARKEEEAEVNSTCEGLTPPLKPPAAADSDDDLDLILGDIDGILSDDDDSGRFKEKPSKPEPRRAPADLRARLPPKPARAQDKKPKQRIVFGDDKLKQERRRRESTPPRRAALASLASLASLRPDQDNKLAKTKDRTPPLKESKMSMRQRITFNQKEAQKEKDDKEKEKDAPKAQLSNRRVILQRKVSQTDKSVFTRVEVTDPTQPNPGIFTRAVRTLGSDKSRIVLNKKQDEKEPQIEYESGSDIDEDKLLEEEIGNLAVVANLPHGMTDTRLKTLAGNHVQSLTLDKEERSAKITFKTTIAAENFKKKFNNKMVAASRLAVTLR